MGSALPIFEDVYYLDVAAELHEYPSREMFLDDCHLTDKGHSVIADLIKERMNKGFQ